MSKNATRKSLLQQFVEMRHIDAAAAASAERNIRACFPKLSENQIERMVIRNLISNFDSCRKSEAAHTPSPDYEQHR